MGSLKQAKKSFFVAFFFFFFLAKLSRGFVNYSDVNSDDFSHLKKDDNNYKNKFLMNAVSDQAFQHDI